ncbi:MAG: DUF3911 family protein [Ectobacillus sp.]
MANLQIKGTRQEVMEMLQLFDLMDTRGLCKLEDHVEVYSYAGQQAESSMFVASIDVKSNEIEVQNVLNDHFVSQMLTGVYND